MILLPSSCRSGLGVAFWSCGDPDLWVYELIDCFLFFIVNMDFESSCTNLLLVQFVFHIPQIASLRRATRILKRL